MEVSIYEHKAHYYETDQMGIIHHSNYIRWFEEARIYWMEKMGIGYDIMEEKGIISPVLAIQCEYKSMTRFNDTVLIETRIKEYTGVKFVIEYTVTDKVTGEVRCIGESRHCFLSKEHKPISLKRSYPEAHQVFLEYKEISK